VFFGEMSILRTAFPGQVPKNWAAALLGSVLGQDCCLCGSGTRGALVCGACDGQLPRIGCACRACAAPLPTAGLCGACLCDPPRFQRATAVFEYRFPVDRLVQRFKYGGALALGAWLAHSLASRCGRDGRPDLLVAPPLTARRLRERGFNQSVELARGAGRALGIAVDAFALQRTGEAPPQQGLGRRARRANLRGAFRARRRFDGARVAMVDDVLTTGATLEALAEVLLEAGAASVEAWVVARTPAPGE
jgi:ComF family protein